MNEQDLKRAFQDVVASSPPPAMDSAVALGRAHEARSRRRASITGAVVAVLVVGVGLGAAFALNPRGTTDHVVGAGPGSSSRAVTEWGEPGPSGPNDRTAVKGPQADRGAQLLELARASVPAGYDAPDIKFNLPGYSRSMLRGESRILTNEGETPEVWQHTAEVPVRKGEKVGALTVQVTTPRSEDATEPCALARRFRPNDEVSCKMIEVSGKQVGVASTTNTVEYTPEGGAILRAPGTWASYRADNGWTVTVLQQAEYQASGHPKLDAEPLLSPQLAALAADQKFLLGS